jgi:GNAT superfamily N-acetyltransferase
MGIEYKKITTLPNKEVIKSIESCVRRFVTESNPDNTPCDEQGYYDQTLKSIAETILCGSEHHQFWLAEYDNEVLAYSICHVSLDVDNTYCYWITQTFVNPKVRRNKIIKIWRQQLYDEAKKLGCKHIIIPSSRNDKAYCRWLGEGWHRYVTLLKKDI